MSVIGWRLGGITLFKRSLFSVAVWVLLAFATTPASAGGVCYVRMPQNIRDAQGFTFTATLLAKTDGPDFSWTLAVEHVFKGADRDPQGELNITVRPGQQTTLYDGGCANVEHLEVGQRYVISKRDLVTFSAASTAVWKLEGNRAQLIRMYPGEAFDRRLTAPKTLDQVLDLMAPGTLPPTSTDAPPVDPSSIARLLFLSFAGTGGWLLWKRARPYRFHGVVRDS